MNPTTTAPRINGLTTAPPPGPAPDPAGPDLLDRVIEATAARHSLADVKTMATAAARSQLYGLSEAQAFTLMMLAEAEGLHPIKALQRYHVIEGKPSMRADAMQAEFQRRGGRLRWVETTAERCRLEAWHPRHHPEHLSFDVGLKDLIDRKVAMQWDKDGRKYVIKPVYQRFPRQMLRARAISEAVRAIDPGVVVGMYTPEEIGDFLPSARSAPPDEPEYSPDPPPWRSSAPAPTRPAPTPKPRPAPPPPGPDPEPDPSPDPDPDPDPEPDDAAAPGPEALSPLRRFVRGAIIATEDELRNALAAAGKPAPWVLDLCNEFQVINGVVRDWVDMGAIDEADIRDEDGKRDRQRIARLVTATWLRDRDGLKDDVQHYLDAKLQAACREHGIAPPGDGDEDQAAADDDPAGAGE